MLLCKREITGFFLNSEKFRKPPHPVKMTSLLLQCLTNLTKISFCSYIRFSHSAAGYDFFWYILTSFEFQYEKGYLFPQLRNIMRP